jgi:biopolymer transport protein ExbB/TolQ
MPNDSDDTFIPSETTTSLNWIQDDVEQRFGFKGGRFTNTNTFLALLIGALLTVLLYLFMIYVVPSVPEMSFVGQIFTRPRNLFTVVPATVLFFWGLSILWLKGRKLKLQAKVLGLEIVPEQPDFIITVHTVKPLLEKLHAAVDHPRHFLLFNRIERALANLRNLGQVGDVSSILRSQAENDEDLVSSSYGVLNGFVWAIPVLGFIGTVMGLSQAIGKFSGVLQDTGEISELKGALQGVTTGLSTAFETTFVSLFFALLLQLAISFRQSQELAFLDECNDYCQIKIISKLRLTDTSVSPSDGIIQTRV